MKRHVWRTAMVIALAIVAALPPGLALGDDAISRQSNRDFLLGVGKTVAVGLITDPGEAKSAVKEAGNVLLGRRASSGTATISRWDISRQQTVSVGDIYRVNFQLDFEHTDNINPWRDDEYFYEYYVQVDGEVKARETLATFHNESGSMKTVNRSVRFMAYQLAPGSSCLDRTQSKIEVFARIVQRTKQAISRGVPFDDKDFVEGGLNTTDYRGSWPKYVVDGVLSAAESKVLDLEIVNPFTVRATFPGDFPHHTGASGTAEATVAYTPANLAGVAVQPEPLQEYSHSLRFYSQEGQHSHFTFGPVLARAASTQGQATFTSQWTRVGVERHHDPHANLLDAIVLDGQLFGTRQLQANSATSQANAPVQWHVVPKVLGEQGCLPLGHRVTDQDSGTGTTAQPTPGTRPVTIGPITSVLAAPFTNYSLTVTGIDPDFLTYDWSITSTTESTGCLAFFKGTGLKAVWDHGEETPCSHAGPIHQAIITVRVLGPNGDLVATRTYRNGSATGTGGLN